MVICEVRREELALTRDDWAMGIEIAENAWADPADRQRSRRSR